MRLIKMAKANKRNRLSVVHGVLTVAAALIILVLSVIPSLSLSFGTHTDQIIFLQIFAIGALCIAVCTCFYFFIEKQLHTFGRQGKLLVLHAALTLVAAVLIMVMSVIPPLTFGRGIIANSGTTIHIMAYCTLCFLLCMWLRVDGVIRFPVLYAVLFSSVYGLLIECIQVLLPYRCFEIGDVMINCLAALITIVPCYVVMRYVPLYKKTTSKQVVNSQ